MDKEQLISEITTTISSLWPDLEIRRDERRLIADAIRSAGFGASVMANGYTLAQWIGSGGYSLSSQNYFKTILLGNRVDLDLVKIPAGSFLMGSPQSEKGRSPDEGPQHKVTLESFFLGRTPITQAQWREVAGWVEGPGERWGLDLSQRLRPSAFQGDDRPVENVSWFEAMEFCSRLSQRTGLTYTLPSEAQWEYACRAGSTTAFHFGATISTELANYDGIRAYGKGPTGEYREQTTPVGVFSANDWGLHDMHGNVREWCLDHWQASYAGAPTDGRPWLDENASEDELKVLRGGSWYNSPVLCRSAYRSVNHPANANNTLGFRVCCLP